MVVRSKKIICFRSGFTLVEALVSTAVLGMFVAGIASFLAVMNNVRQTDQALLEVNGQGQAALRTIILAIQNARAVNAPPAAQSMETLSLATGDTASDPTVFSAANGVLYVTRGAGSAEALTNNKVRISNLAFNNLSAPDTPGSVKIGFTLAGTGPVGHSADFYGAASIR